MRIEHRQFYYVCVKAYLFKALLRPDLDRWFYKDRILLFYFTFFFYSLTVYLVKLDADTTQLKEKHNVLLKIMNSLSIYLLRLMKIQFSKFQSLTEKSARYY